MQKNKYSLFQRGHLNFSNALAQAQLPLVPDYKTKQKQQGQANKQK